MLLTVVTFVIQLNCIILTIKLTYTIQVKNKAPAEIQITAEQLLREAKERDLEIQPPPPKQKISDPEELRDYQHRKRKAFEDNIRKNRLVRKKYINIDMI